ncbi:MULTISPECIES: hypothetical protein [unclassified Synechocystis]|uniref:hypothetical protein n=1 Tax=unclassified Synechocystis TaxID=2640012 RepID=UPI00068EF7B4|nr:MULTISPECIES: hypothetical protein [unclassified Synechocystis]MCT0253010.1 hypothetical protein [Synechocystis sp. CS-94]
MDSKTCTKCHKTKPLFEFHRDARLKTGFTSRCKVCTCEYKRAYYESEEGKAKVKAYNQRNAKRRSEYSRLYSQKYRDSQFKNQRKLEFCLYKGGFCSECGFEATEDTIAAFDFHHINPSEKEYTPSDMLMLRKDKVFKELDKCVLLCSNCHRILHHRQYRAKLLEKQQKV